MALHQRQPLALGLAVLVQQIGPQHAPGQVDVEVRVSLQQAPQGRQEKIQFLLVAVDFHAGARVSPDEAHMGMVAQRLLHLLQIERIAFALGGDVGVQQHRQVIFGRQVVDAAHGFVVGPWRVAVDQRGQVVVAGEHLAYALPEPRVQLQHAADMGVGVLVVGVEAAEKGVETPTLLVRQLPHRGGHQHIGGAVPVGAGVVAGVVAWPLGLVLVPLLGHRNAGDHHMVDAPLVHGRQQGVHAVAFLEEVHVVQVGVAVAVIPRFAG
ncbi:hypothetical protein D9M70_351420 [compost metagenome]